MGGVGWGGLRDFYVILIKYINIFNMILNIKYFNKITFFNKKHFSIKYDFEDFRDFSRNRATEAGF